ALAMGPRLGCILARRILLAGRLAPGPAPSQDRKPLASAFALVAQLVELLLPLRRALRGASEGALESLDLVCDLGAQAFALLREVEVLSHGVDHKGVTRTGGAGSPRRANARAGDPRRPRRRARPPPPLPPEPPSVAWLDSRPTAGRRVAKITSCWALRASAQV